MEELGTMDAIIYKIQTMADGGARLTLDIPQSETEIISKLLAKKLKNEPLVTLGVISRSWDDK